MSADGRTGQRCQKLFGPPCVCRRGKSLLNIQKGLSFLFFPGLRQILGAADGFFPVGRG